jgi:hypothetical protein
MLDDFIILFLITPRIMGLAGKLTPIKAVSAG